MAQGRSTKIISKIKWIWTSRLSIKNSLSVRSETAHERERKERRERERERGREGERDLVAEREKRVENEEHAHQVYALLGRVWDPWSDSEGANGRFGDLISHLSSYTKVYSVIYDSG